MNAPAVTTGHKTHVPAGNSRLPEPTPGSDALPALQFRRINDSIRCAQFSTQRGAQESYIAIATNAIGSCAEALAELKESYSVALASCDLDEESSVFARFYLSDIVNQKSALQHSALYAMLGHAAVSVIEQRPLTPGPLALLAYHIQADGKSLRTTQLSQRRNGWRSGISVEGRNYGMLWTTNFSGFGPLDSCKQTEELFTAHNTVLRCQGMSLRHNTIRTWIYVRDIDNHYSGMVSARKEFMAKEGLTNQTRYVASTGIEGKAADPASLVTVDALSLGNIREEQIVRMEAPEHLSPTILYGVTFERGLRVRFGDRSHLYVSGTASIDRQGKILHETDVVRQTERTIDNIEALLAPHGAALADMLYIVVYVRNPKDYEVIRPTLDKRLPAQTPVIAAEGAVCRPGWLVELEGEAVIGDHTEYPPFL